MVSKLYRNFNSFHKIKEFYIYSQIRFANFEGILGFSVPSIILADLLGNTCLLVIGAFRSTLFVSLFQGSLLVISLYCTVSGNDRLVFFEAFYDLSYSCLLQEQSNVCLLPSTKIPLIIAISFAVLEQFEGQTERVRCIMICINSIPTQMIDGTKKPIRSLQTRSALQRIWL